MARCTMTDCTREAEDPAFKHCERCRERARRRAGERREHHRVRQAEINRRLKREVFEAYGGAKCRCCSEARMEFLSIDHIKGDGAAHRTDLTGSPRNGKNLYAWLKRNGYPLGFQVLCMNCNFAKGHFEMCPHERERQALRIAS